LSFVVRRTLSHLNLLLKQLNQIKPDIAVMVLELSTLRIVSDMQSRTPFKMAAFTTK